MQFPPPFNDPENNLFKLLTHSANTVGLLFYWDDHINPPEQKIHVDPVP